MKKTAAIAGAVLAAAAAIGSLPPRGACVMRAFGTPKELCLRNGAQVRHNVPFPAAEGTPECRPVACESPVRSVLDSSERVPLEFKP